MVEGVTVADLVRPENADMAARLRSVIDERLVLLFPQQRVTPEQYIAFARLFGDLPELKPVPHVEGAAEIKILSNSGSLDGKHIRGGNSAAELIWHADDTYRPEPPSFMFLLAQKVPSTRRPRTSWLSLYEIYEKLDAPIRDKLAGLSAIHAAIGSNDVKYHRGGPTPSVEARQEGSHHPLLRAHPESRRPCLFMPRRRDALVVGKTSSESATLIEPLWDALMSNDHGCSIALNAGDLVVWDNRFTLHARDAWDMSEARTMWRLANTGERPIPVDQSVL
ncbi:TauD/TfdA family dioxygenase [Lichenicola cladoniae]|uniref:TauD/TfdA family dioxygenase n=2 Tax=Lichenicola cladoniae TaxID=1484109 RepID=A0A6M8HML3_9PROT|nr:TauD/TfdA family dioxygenase [Acetobacteraceae bacterium]QKE89575.1 TauD/TfdA family dioxygenase [Lichenicola cladoniae]